jgi:hypothetical protein
MGSRVEGGDDFVCAGVGFSTNRPGEANPLEVLLDGAKMDSTLS